MAYSVELTAEVDRELGKLDPQHSKRILKFLYERVAKLDDPRSIGQALHGSRLGEFWKYRVGDYPARSKTTVWWFCSCASEIARKSIGSALPETVQVIQLQEKTPTARSWWIVERERP